MAIFTFRFTLLMFSGILAIGHSQTLKDKIQFRKIQLADRFISEGVATGDVNHDGLIDVMAGAYWFEAPDWEKHEITEVEEFSPVTDYSTSFLNYAMDVNQDGWIDLIRIGWPGEEAVWYENPKSKPGHWKSNFIYGHLGNESPRFVDIDLDGRNDILGNDPVSKEIIWLKAMNKNGSVMWSKNVISDKEGIPGTHRFTHGLGVGDLNKDGLDDVIITKGWWQRPEDLKNGTWKFHSENIGQDCAQMYAYDFNNDGEIDILSSSAHDYGIWWHEKKKDSLGEYSWTEHKIDDTFSQSHALVLEGINRDDAPDIVTGKRYFAHNGKDPGGHEPAVLYWYEFIPGDIPVWKPHLIDDDSGIGLVFEVIDLNNDGLKDIVTSNKKGVFVFLQEKP